MQAAAPNSVPLTLCRGGTTYLLRTLVNTILSKSVRAWRQDEEHFPMPVSGRFNGVPLRQGPTFEFAEQGLRFIPSAGAMQLRRHRTTLSRQEKMLSASERARSTSSVDRRQQTLRSRRRGALVHVAGCSTVGPTELGPTQSK